MPAAFLALLKLRLFRALVPALVVVLSLIVMLVGAVILSLAGVVQMVEESSADTAEFAPSAAAVADIPAAYLVLYRAAAKKYGIDWAILAAIGSIETDHGRLNAPGVKSGVNSFGCCAGPMQFYTSPYPTKLRAGETNSSTWGAMGVDGNGDGWKDAHDPEDAIPAAARYLKASGAPGDYQSAIFSYNHAQWYVDDVMARAARYRGALKRALTAPTTNVQAAGALELLRSKKITLSSIQRADLRAGTIDKRVTTALVWALQRHTIYVSAMKSDHAPGTNHEQGRAVDIAMVDGVSCTNVARSSPCGRLAVEWNRLPGRMKPTELIFCFDPGPDVGSFARSDHCDHIHLGWD